MYQRLLHHILMQTVICLDSLHKALDPSAKIWIVKHGVFHFTLSLAFDHRLLPISRCGPPRTFENRSSCSCSSFGLARRHFVLARGLICPPRYKARFGRQRGELFLENCAAALARCPEL